jgi:hypothetical protein
MEVVVVAEAVAAAAVEEGVINFILEYSCCDCY